MAAGAVIRFVRASVIVSLTASRTMSISGQHADGAAVHFQAVRSLIEMGRYVEAEAEAERLLTAVSESAEPEELEGPAIDLLVEALLRNGRGAEPRTRELAELGVQARTSRLGSGQSSLAASVRNLGDVLFQAGDYETATQRHREALALIERSPAATGADVAEFLDHLARTLAETGQHDEALRLADRALVLKEERDAAGVAIARTLQVRGFLYQLMGDYVRARPDLERALRLHQAFHSQHPETAGALTLLGAELLAEGDLLEADRLLSDSLSLAEAWLRTDHPDIALMLRTLASALANTGDLAAARSMRERALTIAERSLGSDHPEVGYQLNDLANTLLLQGEYSAARPLYERALEISERRFGANHAAVATRIYNLAILNHRLGDLDEARRQFERAIQTWTRVLGPEHPTVARALSALAEALADEGRHREARPYFERALAIRERALGPNHPLAGP